LEAVKPATTTYREIVGQVIVALREDEGLTQGDLAAKLGITQSVLSRMERGASTLSIDQVRLVADALGVGPDRIVGDAERVAADLRRRGIRVETSRPESALKNGLALISLAVLAGVVLGVVFKGKK
jgi:transcriptional regulator with XRE-family HTH domain